MITRRETLMLIAAAAVAGSSRAALAAQPVVEVLAMAHWPVQRALKPVRDLLAKYQGRVHVTDIDIESADGVKRLKAVGALDVDVGDVHASLILGEQIAHRLQGPLHR